MKKNNTRNWKKYGMEFLSVFIAVISAFALSNWNDNRNSRKSEQKILLEINNGLSRDLKDFSGNMTGHKFSLRANTVFRDLLQNKLISQDSIRFYYISLFRDYPPIVNRSGYESLKANGLKTISNDSLRFQIIALYDYYYSIIEILEEEVREMQSFENFFAPVNDLLHPYIEFDSSGIIKMITYPDGLSDIEKNEILSYIWRLEENRKYKLKRYELVRDEIKKLKYSIENELQNR